MVVAKVSDFDFDSLTDEQIQEIADNATPEERRGLLVLGLLGIGNPCTVQGYLLFYEIIFGVRPPPYAREWVQASFDTQGDKGLRGLVLEAFRGSTKTTLITIGLTAFLMGHNPEWATLLVQVGDAIAENNTAAVAGIIEHNPGWKAIFPNIVPDKVKGWGAKGYEIKDTSVSPQVWASRNAKRKDASLLGVGIKSNAIIGKHPDRLVIDDIHNRANTASAREMAGVIGVFKADLLPAIKKDTWVDVCCTPWKKNDAYAWLKSSGRYKVVTTPVYKEDENGDAEYKGKRVSLAWPAEFDAAEIEKREDELSAEGGLAEFPRMFLLDLTKAEGLALKAEWLHEFPVEKIGISWPVVMGVDYASTQDKLRDGKRDYFALAVLKLIPGGGAVLVDGVRMHLSQGEAEEKVKAIAATYPYVRQIGIENIGKGEEFYSLMLRTSTLPLMPLSWGRKSKGARFESQMSPAFRSNRVWISDGPNEFLRMFRQEWVGWPFEPHDDTLDAVYCAMSAAQHNLVPPPPQKGIFKPRVRATNPYAALGRR